MTQPPANHQVSCPICRAQTDWSANPNRPFCSRKCKTEDLHNWLTDRYVIAGDSDSAVANSELSDDSEN
ncbi:MAG: DNA gyrase inhibitor YacG [Gammaproteobacteria bacterium]